MPSTAALLRREPGAGSRIEEDESQEHGRELGGGGGGDRVGGDLVGPRLAAEWEGGE